MNLKACVLSYTIEKILVLQIVAVFQLLSEECKLQEMKGGGDSSAYSVTNHGGSSSKSTHQVAPPNSNPKKGPMKNKDNLRCNCCKRKGHTKEKCWKVHGRPPYIPHQVHMISHPHFPLGDISGGQQWAQKFLTLHMTPPYTNLVQPPVNTNAHVYP